MTKRIYWFFDLLALCGAGLLAAGLYLAFGLAAVLMVAGALLCVIALRCYYTTREIHESAEPIVPLKSHSDSDA